MVMTSSGTISLFGAATELGTSGTINMNDTRVRRLAGVGLGSTIYMSQMYGQKEYLSDIAYITQYSPFTPTTGTSTYTISNASLGGWTDSSKIVVFCVRSTYQQRSEDTNIPNISSCTVGGVNAFVLSNTRFTYNGGTPAGMAAYSSIIICPTTATAGNIVLNFDENAPNNIYSYYIYSYQIRGKSSYNWQGSASHHIVGNAADPYTATLNNLTSFPGNGPIIISMAGINNGSAYHIGGNNYTNGYSGNDVKYITAANPAMSWNLNQGFYSYPNTWTAGAATNVGIWNYNNI